MRILVCGGRDYDDQAFVFNILNRMHKATPITHIIHGGARGADTLAGEWAKFWKVEIIECKAEWERYGKSAGHIRNGEMLKHKPDMVVGFPGGNGTANMLQQAKKAGIRAYSLKGRQHADDRVPYERS